MHQPEQLACLPRHHPLFPKPAESYKTFPEHIPEQDWAYSLSTPTPVVARRGQALVFTQALLHTGKIVILFWICVLSVSLTPKALLFQA